MAGFLVRPLSRVPFLFIVGRMYGDAAFGRLVFAVGLFEAAAAFARLGVRDTLFRFLAENADDPQGAIVDAAVLTTGLAVLTSAAVVAGTLLVPADLGSAELWSALRAIAPLLPVFVLTDVLLAATRSERAVVYEVTARSLVEPALVTLGAAALGAMGRASGLLEAYAVAQVAALTVAVVGVGRLLSWRRLSWPNWARMRRYAASSAPTGFADCMNLAFLATGTVAVGHFGGPAAVGVYGMALNLETALSKIRQAFDMIVVPVVSQSLAQRSAEVTAQLRDIGRWVLNAQLPVLAIFVLFGDLLLGLFGRDFAAGGTVLAWLGLAAVIDGALNLAQVPLYLQRPKTNFLIALLALALHAALSCVLVPRFGAVGAGISMSATLALAGIMRQAAARRLLGQWLVDLRMLRPVVAAGIGFGIAALIAALVERSIGGRLIGGAGFLVAYAVVAIALDADLRRRLTATAKKRLSLA